jgi:farnesyl-diphosphate farnesyltransferase
MKPSSGLLWSPWLRIIVEKFLVYWWADLDRTLNTDDFVDYKTIYRFDPTNEHMGGAGDAKSWLGKADSPYKHLDLDSLRTVNGSYNQNLKQGAYGKVKIHSHSKLSQLMHVDEVISAILLIITEKLTKHSISEDESMRFCDGILGSVSRSFAGVIRQLPSKLYPDIMLFYLALRALDTIEDDMEAFKGKEKVKIEHLKKFYSTALITDGWKMTGVGQGDERKLLEEYFKCVKVFKSLPSSSQEVISDIAKRMGEGMASFVEIDLGQGTVTMKDYNLYCHYVAGLVGEGLSRLFTATG